jgi:hypothetical protein
MMSKQKNRCLVEEAMIAAAECGRVRLLVRGRAHGRKARRRGAAAPGRSNNNKKSSSGRTL